MEDGFEYPCLVHSLKQHMHSKVVVDLYLIAWLSKFSEYFVSPKVQKKLPE